jgi:hypothetical protein
MILVFSINSLTKFKMTRFTSLPPWYHVRYVTQRHISQINGHTGSQKTLFRVCTVALFFRSMIVTRASSACCCYKRGTKTRDYNSSGSV